MKETYEEIFRIKSDFKIPTLNDWARVYHFKRHDFDKKNQENFMWLLSPYIGKYIIICFEIEVLSNLVADVDNTIIIAKNFVDAMKRTGMITNDNRKIYKGVYLGINKKLAKGFYEVIVKGIFTEKA